MMENVPSEWRSLMRFCKENPFCTFEKLDIKGGKPAFWTTRQQVSETAYVVIKHIP